MESPTNTHLLNNKHLLDNPAEPKSPSCQKSSTNDLQSMGRKKMKVKEHEEYNSTSETSRYFQVTLNDLLRDLETGKYGSVAKDIEDLFKQRMDVLKPCYAMSSACSDQSINEATETNQKVDLLGNDHHSIGPADLIVLDDSDEEAPGDQRPFYACQNSFLNMPAANSPLELTKNPEYNPRQASTSSEGDESIVRDMNAKEDKGVSAGVDDEGDESIDRKTNAKKDKGVFVGVDDDSAEENNQQCETSDDDVADMWQQMNLAIECAKETSLNPPEEYMTEDEEECEHSFILKDDLGYVCRICGIVQRRIESIVEYQFPKKESTRTYRNEARNEDEGTDVLHERTSTYGHNFVPTEFYAHPRHRKKMKPHQVEGFNFLAENLVNDDNPGGCILAHAPGSGKTFMIISFIQSFMAKYPFARPLVVLPRGILPTWKKEFLLWQVEDIPLLDFYSEKADSRSQQLEVMKQWVERRSILFLGYKQFSSIVCGNDISETAAACQNILLTHPSVLIMDEGHTPRNENTDQLAALEKVQTPRKVVLSGTLYQNHVKEVFNILNLVRPKFLMLETSRSIKKRILSRVESTRRGNMLKKSNNEFYELVEKSLLKDDNLKRRAAVIQDLREMTSKVLHYYKGDFLDELPGLVDFTVFLNLSDRQKREVDELKKTGRKFKISSDGSAIYVHPQLKHLINSTAVKDRIDQVKIDRMLKQLKEKGVKAKFYLNLLRLCEASGEKLLVFSQYLLPMKFLERLTVKVKGWSPGKEIFMITGDSDSDVRESYVEQFNNSSDARVFFGSIKACGEGISLVGASRIIILDVHLNPSVTRQAIGRAFRPGQVRKVYTYRLVAAESPEEDDHSTCFRKECIAKLWFEWNECCRPQDFQMETIDVTDCGDRFLETPWLHEDVLSLYKR